MLEQSRDRAENENPTSQGGEFSTQFRAPPRSERLQEVSCRNCNHVVYVTPRETEKFFAGYKECPECNYKKFDIVKREDKWFEYLGRDPKKSDDVVDEAGKVVDEAPESS